jgi:ubiquinone/menaquinone biosynthesis C-methylase UbiE
MGDAASMSQLKATWEAAAPGWAKWERVFSEGLAQATADLLDMAAVGPGARVLDVASGAGAQTIAAARRVGPAGTVVAADISPTMLAHVRRNAEAAGLANVVTVESAAESLPDSEGPFDAAICRLGLMLFPEPSAAVEAVRRALKPGARFAALVFTTPAASPYMAEPMAILLRHAGRQPPGKGRPGIFALGEAGVLGDLLSAGGLQDVTVRTVRCTLALPNADDALTMMQQAFGAYRAVIADLGERERAAAWSEVEACIRRFEGPGGFATELEFVIGSGAAP